LLHYSTDLSNLYLSIVGNRNSPLRENKINWVSNLTEERGKPNKIEKKQKDWLFLTSIPPLLVLRGTFLENAIPLHGV